MSCPICSSTLIASSVSVTHCCAEASSGAGADWPAAGAPDTAIAHSAASVAATRMRG